MPKEEEVHIEGWHLDINTQELRWESYVKAGYYGVLNHYFSPSNRPDAPHPVPTDLLVTGSVPAGSGLSSSAAMVVASTLAFLAVNGKVRDCPPWLRYNMNMNISDMKLDEHNGLHGSRITKGELVKMSMENEKRVGVNSGGMDQAASVMSTPASALYIAFHPTLEASPTPLPPAAVFVCANSLIVADKVVGAKRGYNLRVVETLVGARVLARMLGISIGKQERLTYRELLGRVIRERRRGAFTCSTEGRVGRMVRKVEALRPRGNADDGELGVTMDEMIQLSGLSAQEFHITYLSWVEVEATRFQLYKRAKHVYSEALRVLQFQQECANADVSDPSDINILQNLGKLMNESQISCAQFFECSCPELDNLTELSRQAGAFGSRLTGAGWGGCTVSLVAEGQVEQFIEKIRNTYPPYAGLDKDALNEVIFATKPSSGACVYKFS
ncbi:GHMP kinase [Infundibulicybe gibba]|nr:GHMP kinase [Infundibulicybe gibba]